MKKILFVCAGQEFPKGAFAFLNSLQEQESFELTGLFFSPIDYDAMIHASHAPGTSYYVQIKEKELDVVLANKTIFAHQCSQHFIKFHIHENADAWDRQLFARQSRFSDLVVLSGENFYNDIDASQPNLFLNEALQSAECPVMIIPETYTPFQHTFLAYDGSRESMLAIKQYCYLFPFFTDSPTEIIYVNEEPAKEIPDLELLKAFSRQHFNCLGFSKLHLKAARYFATWLGEKKPSLLVSGSFGRSSLSYMTHRSFAREAVHEHKMPIFIAHS